MRDIALIRCIRMEYGLEYFFLLKRSRMCHGHVYVIVISNNLVDLNYCFQYKLTHFPNKNSSQIVQKYHQKFVNTTL